MILRVAQRLLQRGDRVVLDHTPDAVPLGDRRRLAADLVVDQKLGVRVAREFLFEFREFLISKMIAEFDDRIVAHTDPLRQCGDRQKRDLLIVFHHKGSHLLLRRREIVLLSPDVVEQLHYVSHSSSSSHASAPYK